jgi:2-amino-4-hydroxy-6-hydroxymethyldihydropteridine diphosphokinase
MRTGIALGSNLGDRMAHLVFGKSNVESLGAAPCMVSRIYETEAVDCAPGTPAFLNAVIEFDFCGNLFDLLASLQGFEVIAGRPAIHEYNTPRPLDLDILYSGNVVIDGPSLTVPHPRLSQRRFVLQPLSDIRPGLFLPGYDESIESLLAKTPLRPQVCLYAECF